MINRIIPVLIFCAIPLFLVVNRSLAESFPGSARSIFLNSEKYDGKEVEVLVYYTGLQPIKVPKSDFSGSYEYPKKDAWLCGVWTQGKRQDGTFVDGGHIVILISDDTINDFVRKAQKASPPFPLRGILIREGLQYHLDATGSENAHYHDYYKKK